MGHSTKYVELCKQIVLESIDKTKYAVFLFGSRAFDSASKFSDIDIGILGEEIIPLNYLFSIQNILEEKDLPYKVDIVDFSKVNKQFKDIALRDIIIWNQPVDLKIS